ncbi:MAG: glutathione S-transferase [Hellea sp.]|nr:glutathione S-transferase [Hellea sp.]
MKLHHSPMSPFARKCRILIRAKGLDVEEIVAANDPENGYASHINPLGKIPALEREGALTLFDSPLICEYLDSLSNPWLPISGENRWKAFRLHRIGDGLSEAMYNLRYETVREERLHWPKIITRHENAIKNTVDYLETIVDYIPKGWSFGTIAVICALDYVDYRGNHLDWRSRAAELAIWHKGFERLAEWSDTNDYKR